MIPRPSTMVKHEWKPPLPYGRGSVGRPCTRCCSNSEHRWPSAEFLQALRKDRRSVLHLLRLSDFEFLCARDPAALQNLREQASVLLIAVRRRRSKYDLGTEAPR